MILLTTTFTLWSNRADSVTHGILKLQSEPPGSSQLHQYN